MRLFLVLVLASMLILGGVMSPAWGGVTACVEQISAGPALFVNGRATAPSIFFVNYSPDPELRAAELQEIAMAAAQGVNLLSICEITPWPEVGQALNFSGMDRQMNEIIQVNPDALIVPRLFIGWPSPTWIAQHSDQMMVYADGTVGTVPSIHSEAWRRDAQDYMRKIIAHLEATYPNNIIGYMPAAQNTGEWFYNDLWAQETPGFETPAKDAFRAYLKAKYVTNAALRQAWGDPSADLDTVEIPSAQACLTSTKGWTFRDPQVERKVIDFFAFQNDAMADTAALMCQTVKEAAPNKLALVFYGYHFELSTAVQGVQSGGHLAFGRLLESPYVDAVCSPVSYLDRSDGGGGYFMSPADSANLHGKLWLNEDDTRTYLSSPTAGFGRADTPRKTAGVLARNFAHVLTHGDALWWMDLEGSGWFADTSIWEQLGKLRETYQSSMHGLSQYRPEIAIIVDERSCLDLHPSPQVAALVISEFRKQWYRIGAPVGIYLLDDLIAGIVPPAKMYVFLNTFRLDSMELQAVRQQACRDGCTVLWMYAPGIVRDNAINTDFVNEVTGLTLTQTTLGTGSITISGMGQSFYAGHGHLTPTFAANDAAATVLARYAYGNEAAVASKVIGGCTSVYSGVLQLPSSLLRDLAQQAGVHVYGNQGDVTMVGNGFVGLHASSTGTRTLAMPDECWLLDPVTGEQFGKASSFPFDMERGDTKLFRVRHAAETSSSADQAARWPASALVDGSVSTTWSSRSRGTANASEWAYLYLGAPTSTGGLLVMPAAGGVGFPVDFKFQYSNDGFSWIDIARWYYTGYPNPGSTLQTFVFPYPVIASCFRLLATRLASDGAGGYALRLADMAVIPHWYGTMPEVVPPSGSVVIDGGAAYAGSCIVELSISAVDTCGLGVSQMRFSNDGSTWSAWEPFASSRIWATTSGSGSRTVYVQFKDSAGNVSASASDSIVVDIDPPTGSVSINSGAAYATSANVTLAISAADPLSGISSMRLSNDGLAWGPYEPYRTSTTWTLASDSGAQTVYAQFQDAAGNVSRNCTDTISVDSVAPTTPGTPTDAGAYSSTTLLKFSWTGSTDTGGSGLLDYICRIGSSPGAGNYFNGSIGTVLTKSLSGSFGRSYFCSIQARDAAGNLSPWSASSDGVTVVRNPGISASGARWLADSSTLGLSSNVVTAIFGDCFYVEDADRSAGMRITPIGGLPAGLAIGSVVDVGGTIRKSTVGERYVNGTVTVR